MAVAFNINLHSAVRKVFRVAAKAQPNGMALRSSAESDSVGCCCKSIRLIFPRMGTADGRIMRPLATKAAAGPFIFPAAPSAMAAGPRIMTPGGRVEVVVIMLVTESRLGSRPGSLGMSVGASRLTTLTAFWHFEYSAKSFSDESGASDWKKEHAMFIVSAERIFTASR